MSRGVRTLGYEAADGTQIAAVASRKWFDQP